MDIQLNQLFLRLLICVTLLALMLTSCSFLFPTSQPPKPTETPIQPLPPAAKGVGASLLDGTWQGAIKVPGQELGILVKITSKAEGVEATMDIPTQDTVDLPMHDVKVELPRVHFEVLEGEELAVMDGELGPDGKIAGKFTEAGIEGTFELVRQAAGSAAAAQTSPPPALTPYAIPGGRVEEIDFESGPFGIVGDLWLPEGEGPFPLVVFVHGDGPIDRTSFGMYLPLMERMLRAGYATFAWDKPGTGESTGQIDRSQLIKQRAQIVLDAIEVMKAHRDIDPRRIGLWGASQAGYVMPRALSTSEDIAFMICVSCPGASGDDQYAFLVTSEALCNEVPEEKADQKARLLAELDRARTYETYEGYLHYREVLEALAQLGSVSLGNWPAMPEEAWQKNDPEIEGWWNPIEVIGQTEIPVLAIFGEKDSQGDSIQGAYAWRKALEQAGNPSSRVEIFPGADHLLGLSKTGCMKETWQMMEKVVRDQGYESTDEILEAQGQYTPLSKWPYAPGYLDLIEEWLRDLRR